LDGPTDGCWYSDARYKRGPGNAAIELALCFAFRRFPGGFDALRPRHFAVAVREANRPRGLISSQNHADVVAALLLRTRQVPGQVQARLGDSLYLIGPPNSAVIKIGRPGDPERRLRALAMSSPVRLVIHHVEPGLGVVETKVHKMLDDWRLHGEWFDFKDADPVRIMRDTLRAIPDLDWLWRVPHAYEAIAAESALGEAVLAAHDAVAAAVRGSRLRAATPGVRHFCRGARELQAGALIWKC
jgi:hypothetical protein